MGCAHKILYVESSPETIIKRYKETRRLHPLTKNGRTLEEAVHRERTILEPVRTRADYIIDTTALSTAKLRGEVLRLFDAGEEHTMSVSVTSFGFKFGIPIEADLVFDVRFMPNPFYIAELRNLTGLDKPVFDFVSAEQGLYDLSAAIGGLSAASICGGGEDRPGHRRGLHRGEASVRGGDAGLSRFHSPEGLQRQ